MLMPAATAAATPALPPRPVPPAAKSSACASEYLDRVSTPIMRPCHPNTASGMGAQSRGIDAALRTYSITIRDDLPGVRNAESRAPSFDFGRYCVTPSATTSDGRPPSHPSFRSAVPRRRAVIEDRLAVMHRTQPAADLSLILSMTRRL